MTEDDAKTKWCPFAREICPVNRFSEPNTRCLASGLSCAEHFLEIRA